MDNYERSYIDHSLIQRTLDFRSTKEALASYFQEAEIHPNAVQGDGGHFQLYFRLKETELSIQQFLFIYGTDIICRTTIAVISMHNPWQAQALRPLIAEINSEIEYGQFNLDVYGTGDVQFWDCFSPEEPFKEETLFYYFEKIERLIGYPHFPIDREYGTEFLQIKETT